MKKALVRIREIAGVCWADTPTPIETEFYSNKSIKKIVNYCLKNDFSFKVGIKKDKEILNKNYIEIFNDWFILKCYKNREEKMIKGGKLRRWLGK